MMEAVIFIGIQGSGKSTFYKERFVDTHIRINLDMLKTRHREQYLVNACIVAKQAFVVDNTNPTRADRSRYIEPAKAAGFKVIGYYFQPRSKPANSGTRTGPRIRSSPCKGYSERTADWKCPAATRVSTSCIPSRLVLMAISLSRLLADGGTTVLSSLV